MADSVSNDAILAHEQAIRDEVASRSPLVAPPVAVESLASEFAEDAVRAGKLKELGERFALLRRIRGDGDCFYRAIAYAFLTDPAKSGSALAGFKARTARLYEQAGFESFAYECFLDELAADEAELGETWTKNAYAANAAVMVFRLLSSAYIRTHRSEYELYVDDAGGSFEDLCKSIACLSTDADNVAISGLAMALDVHIEIAYFDGHEGPLNYHRFNEGSDKWTVSLLYRPGHYDLLLPAQ